MTVREMYYCPTCDLAPVAADEDGCCASCGSDCEIRPDDSVEREAAIEAFVAAYDEWDGVDLGPDVKPLYEAMRTARETLRRWL